MKRRYFLIALSALLIAGCTPKYNDPQTPRATKGSPQAQVTVEEFADFQCPACGAAYPIVKQLQEKYGDRVYWKFYHFPLVSIHPYAFGASLAAECANDQGKFWEYHDILYENQKKLTNSDLTGYAEKLGLNLENFQACYKSRAKTKAIRQDMSLGDQRKVQGTPSFYLNGELVEDWTTLSTRLEEIIGPIETPAKAAQE